MTWCTDPICTQKWRESDLLAPNTPAQVYVVYTYQKDSEDLQGTLTQNHPFVNF